ncbi:MAG: hypothetical protein HC869_08135 [Rhodospirillales bacterium]|nr:hypothetical protein [Rhodospirillales bacterium]
MSKVRPLPPDALRHMEQEADELVAALSGQFHTYAGAALAAIEGLMMTPCYDDEVWRARLNGLAHDLKGLGGTFDYDLITIVAESMCRAITDQAVVTDEGLQRRLAAMATALRAIVQFNLKGDGGVQGRDLIATLQLPTT